MQQLLYEGEGLPALLDVLLWRLWKCAWEWREGLGLVPHPKLVLGNLRFRGRRRRCEGKKRGRIRVGGGRDVEVFGCVGCGTRGCGRAAHMHYAAVVVPTVFFVSVLARYIRLAVRGVVVHGDA